MNSETGYRRIWQIAVPIIIGSIVQNLLNIIDTIFLGRLGEVALGAGAIGGLLHLAAVMVAYGFTIGTQIVVARRYGQKKYGSIGITLTHSLYFLSVLVLLLFWVLWQMAPTILGSMIHSPRIMEASIVFLSWRKWGLFFVTISLLFQAFYIGIGKTRIISVANSLAVITNIVLAYGLVFGNLGLPKMGIAGAALASVIAELVGCLFYIIYTMITVDSAKYNLFAFTRFSSNFFNPLLRISLPTMFQNLLSFTSWLLFFLFVEGMGERVLAASNIVRSLYVLLLIPVWGIASATSSLTSFLIGRGRKEEVMGLVWRAEVLSLGCVMVVMVITSLFARDLLSLYSNDLSLIEYTLPVLYVVAIAGPVLSVGFIAFNAVAGTGKTNVTFILETADLGLYVLLGFLFTKVLHLSISAAWTVEIFYGLFMAVAALLYLKYGNWRSSSHF